MDKQTRTHAYTHTHTVSYTQISSHTQTHTILMKSKAILASHEWLTPSSSYYVWHAWFVWVSFVRVAWLLHADAMPRSYVWRASFICVAHLLHKYAMPHSYVWHDSFQHAYVDMFPMSDIHIHMCDMPPSCICQASIICISCPIHKWETPHSYICKASFICTYSQLQIGWHSILRLFLKTFGLYQAYQDDWYNDWLCGTNRKFHGQNSGSLEKFSK